MKKFIISLVCLVLSVAVAAGIWYSVDKAEKRIDQRMQQEYQAGYDSRDAEIAELNAERAKQMAALNAQIADLQEQLANAADPEEIAALNAQIVDLQAQIEELQNNSQNSEMQSVIENLKESNSILAETEAFQHLVVLSNATGKTCVCISLLTYTAEPLTLDDVIATLKTYVSNTTITENGIPACGVSSGKQIVRVIHLDNNCFMLIAANGASYPLIDNEVSQFYDFVTQIL